MLRKITPFTVYRLPFTVREIFFCVLSALLLILSFPNFNFWLLAWFGFVPLFFAIENKSKFKAFLLSYLTGVIFWLGIIYWLVHVTLPGLIILVLYLALYFGLFGLIVSTYLLPTTYYLLFIPAIWVLLEYLRSHLFTGFPWALLGYSQYLNLPFIQVADITGVWGVSFLVMLVNVTIYSLIANRLSPIAIIKKYSAVTLCIVVTLTYGYYKLYHRASLPIRQAGSIEHRLIKISVIQGNISQELKWNKSSRDFIMERYFSLTKEALRDKPDLIIWPEAALPVVLEEEPPYYERVKDFVKEVKAPLLFGAVTLRDNLYYNSALLISRGGWLLGKYDKLHLVPFGEYIPLGKIFGFLETIVPIGDFSSGKEYTVFRLPTKFSVLICFEDLFPDLSREFVKRGAGFLVNITNDAWFEKTSSPYQHLCASVFRAVENRVSLVRSANTGVSGFIAPTGKIVSLVGDKPPHQNFWCGGKFGNNIFISGYKNQEISVSKQANSFYTRYGNIFVTVCLLFVLGGIIIFIKRP